MGSIGVNAFPEIPIFLQSDDSVPADQIWPSGFLSTGSISPQTVSSSFEDDSRLFWSMSQVVEDYETDIPCQLDQIGLNPMLRFQSDSGNAPYAPVVAGTDYMLPDAFPACTMKVDSDQLYLHHVQEPYRQQSPVGSESTYSGGGSFSSAGSDVYQMTPRSSVSSQHSYSHQWCSNGPYAMASPEPASADETVNMGLVQQFADRTGQTPEPDAPYSSDESEYQTQSHYGLYVHPGYNAEEMAALNGGPDYASKGPVHGGTSPCAMKEEDDEEQDDNESDDPTFDPVSRSRRPRTSSMTSSPRLSRRAVLSPRNEETRVTKGKGKSKKQPQQQLQSDASRPFPCPLAIYGCSSRFAAKNEWKRHISTLHIKTDMWRCDQCPVSADPANPNHNDFYRRDLFMQHLHRMHGPEDSEGNRTTASPSSSSSKGKSKSKSGSSSSSITLSDEAIANCLERCRVHIRDTPRQSSCVVCSKSFTGPGSWEERIEHMANAHFEKDKKSSGKSAVALDCWRRDAALERWYVDEGFIERDASGEWRLGNGIPKRAPHAFD